jgi:Zn-dependent membrane protease YugP/Flp pilus assembly protein TadD
MAPYELMELISGGDRLAVTAQMFMLAAVVVGGGALYAAIRHLRAAYAHEGRRFSHCRLTGREAVVRFLKHLGLPADRVDDGAAIDHYDDRRRRIRLRTESSVSSTVAALAIAAHEVGHAEQFAGGFWAARAMRGLRVLLVLSAAVLISWPFAGIILGRNDVNLTQLMALIILVPLLRLAVMIPLELDATKRGNRLLDETGLAQPDELEGIARLLRAGFFTHLALGIGLVLFIAACAAMMCVVESALDSPDFLRIEIAQPNAVWPSAAQPPIDVVGVDGVFSPSAVAVVVAVATVWWSFSGGKRKTRVRSAVDLNNDGMARFYAGDVAGAFGLIDEALRLDPALASAHYNRAVVLASQGRCPDALASIEAVFTCRTEDIEPLIGISDPWYLRGSLRLDQGNYDGAIADFSRALDLEPSDPATLLCHRGLAWIKLERLGEALQDTNDSLRLSPESAVALTNRGVIYRELGNLEQAASDLRRAIALDPELPNPREHLAKVLESQQVASLSPAEV